MVLFAGLAVLYYFFDPAVNNWFPPCPFYRVTGYFCPGCGSQRAFHSLLHLDLPSVFRNNFLFLPALLLIGYHYMYPYANRLPGIRLPDLLFRRATPWILLFIIILFWILRNIPAFPFYLLTPESQVFYESNL